MEQYHKALKSGTKVEASQLERGYRLESLVAVLAIVAVRLLNAQWLARARGDEAVDEAVLDHRHWPYWRRCMVNPRVVGLIAACWWQWHAWAGSWHAVTMACRVGKRSGAVGND